MNGYLLAVAVMSFAPALVCLGIAARILLDPRDLSPSGAGFGWGGFILGGSALLLVDHIISKAMP